MAIVMHPSPLLAFFLVLGQRALGANILGLLGLPSPSVQLWNGVLLHRLGELGHNVTVLSVDIPKLNTNISKNVHYIYLEKGYTLYDTKYEDKALDINDIVGADGLKSIIPFYDFGELNCKAIARSDGLQTLLNYPENFKFDVVINDYSVTPCLLGFVHRFKYPPLIGFSSFPNPPSTIDAMFNHYFPAYVPYYCTEFNAEMTFAERFQNTLIFILDTVYRRLIYLPRVDAIMRPHFPKDTPYLDDITKLTAISLVNTHPPLLYPEPLPPNIIEIGGMQILDPSPLPKDLNDIINQGKKGAIFVSFGTNMASADFTDSRVDVIFNAMAQLPEYTFLWKFDEKYLKHKLPRHIFVRSFFPQKDILANPRIKAFVSHCGAMSSQEATWRGVPVIGIPLFIDQFRNCHSLVVLGTAKKLDFLTMTTEMLRDTIKQVAEDKVIANRVKEVSKQYQDRPMKPLDVAVWWVEYVLRNPNSHNLKSAASKLNIFQAHSLDVLLVLGTIFTGFIYLLVKLTLLILKRIVQGKRGNLNKLKTH